MPAPSLVRRAAPVLAALVLLAGTTSAQEAGPRPLPLGEAMARALESSEALGIAEAGVLRARGEVRRARSGYFPQLAGSASYLRTLDSRFAGLQSASEDTAGGPRPTSCPRFVPNTGAPIGERVDSLERSVECLASVDPFGAFQDLPFGQRNEYNAGLALSQTLFDPRLGGLTRAARADARRAEVVLARERARVTLDLTRAYYDAALSDQLLAVAESTLAQAERTLRETELARDVGTAPEFDRLRAQVSRDTQRPIVIQRRAARDIAHLRLKQLVGLPLQQEVRLTTDLADTAAVSVPLPASGDTARDGRSPVREASEAVRASEGLLGSARGRAWPSLTLSSQYVKVAFPASGLPGSGDFLTDWTVGVRLEWALFTGGRTSGDKLVAEANLLEARLRLEQARERAERDTRNAFTTLDAARAAWEASGGTVEQAERAYGIAEVRFREGISTQTELADARLLLQQARINRAQAARDFQVARLRTALLHDLPFEGESPPPGP